MLNCSGSSISIFIFDLIIFSLIKVFKLWWSLFSLTPLQFKL
jgi:hypothetical protein